MFCYERPHYPMGVVFMCINPSIGYCVAKMSHLFHAIAWQLIVNEFPSYAKALNLLGFLKKHHTYTHIHAFCTCKHAYVTHIWAYMSVGGHVPLGGVCVVCMYKYTDSENQVLTTRVTDVYVHC